MNRSDQSRIPIVDAIRAYAGVRRIHMPGHKGGTGVAEPFLSLVGRQPFAADVVGVEGLDDYFAPTGCIQEAQQLAADAWGADRTFFLVNGTSSGVHAAILSVCGPGDELIVPRNIHRSVVGGMILSGARPVYVEPEIDESFGLPLGVTPRAIERAIAGHPAAKGVLIVSPTYYGVVSDVRAIAEVVHDRGLPLLVDGAHGAHLGFHRELPPPSLTEGADAVALGVHKTAGSLSQGSMLHLKGERISAERVRRCLGLLQTTSPSYLILGSLDAARFLLANDGERRLEAVLSLARRIREGVTAMAEAGAAVRTWEMGASGGPRRTERPFCTDPTRVVLHVRATGMTGNEVERRLRREHGVQIELSDAANIVLLLSVGDTEETADHFLRAFEDVVCGTGVGSGGDGAGRAVDGASAGTAGSAAGSSPVAHAAAPGGDLTGGLVPKAPPIVLSPADAFRRPLRRVRLEESTNLVSGEMIAAYPPGVPVIYPGERLTRAVTDYLVRAREAGVHLSGGEDSRMRWINVIDV